MTIAGSVLRQCRFFPRAIVMILLPGIPNLRAGSATWSPTNPLVSDWVVNSNWMPMTIPSDIAFFGPSTITNVSGASGLINGITFNIGASAYNIRANSSFADTPAVFGFGGAGITNNSGQVQNFYAGNGAGAGIITFRNNATAGTSTTFSNAAGNINTHGYNTISYTIFYDNSTAGGGTFINYGSSTSRGTYGAFPISGGFTEFYDNSTAANGIFINHGGTVSNAPAGLTDFREVSSAGSSSLTANGGTGGGSGSEISFFDNSSGGTARAEIFGNGSLHIDAHNAPGVTIGSIAGTGQIILGSNRLTVGSNDLSTTFSGIISGSGSGGSIAKIGAGELTLSHIDTYSGGTIIGAGNLKAAHDGVLGKGDVDLTGPGATLRLQNGATNNYIANTAELSVVNGSTVDLNFTGPPDIINSLTVAGVIQAPGVYGSAASGAPHQIPQLTGTGTIQVGPPPKADFHGTGKSDILWQNNLTGARLIWLMNGIAFAGSVNLGNVATAWTIAGVGDFNSDGKSDILWQNNLTGARLVWLMNGTALAGSVSLGNVATAWTIAGVGDFNGDGKSDILWQHSSGARNIWLMDGTVHSSSVSLGTVAPAWKIVGSGHFNGDGKSDILWQHSSGACSIWLMDGTVHSSSVSLGTVAKDWNIVGSGDFNGDAKSDILWEHTSGARAIWLMNGTVRSSVVSLGTVPTAWSIKNY